MDFSGKKSVSLHLVSFLEILLGQLHLEKCVLLVILLKNYFKFSKFGFKSIIVPFKRCAVVSNYNEIFIFIRMRASFLRRL